jgi:2-iminoacetate synthase ThiH
MDQKTIERWITAPAAALMPEAAALRDAAHGRIVSYSRKVFIPLTRLCRDVCSYCTFARAPRPGEAAYLAPDEVLAIARAGREAGCHEALFTLGDKPSCVTARHATRSRPGLREHAASTSPPCASSCGARRDFCRTSIRA